MRQYIDVTGKTEEEAINAALAQLSMDRDDVSVELLSGPRQASWDWEAVLPRSGSITARRRNPRRSSRKESRSLSRRSGRRQGLKNGWSQRWSRPKRSRKR